jgi:hypothetical protein
MRHFLNDIEITPRNRTEIGVQSDFTGNPNILSLSTDSVILPREAFQQVMAHISTAGVFEGIPYRIELSSGVAIEYYVDFLDGFKVKMHEVEVKLKRRKGYDDFKEKADGTSWELMLDNGVSFNNVQVDYFVIAPDMIAQAIPLLLCGYVMTKELINAGKEVADSISELIQAVTPSVGVGVVMDTGDIIVLALKVAFRIIMFALILLAVIELATQLFLLLFPPKRKLKGTKFSEMLTKGCAYLGYTFQSTIFDAEPNWTCLPVPLTKSRGSIFDIRPESWLWAFNKGVPSASDTTPTLGQFIDAMETMFNARCKVINGVVRLERWDYWSALASAQLSPALNLQGTRDEEYTFNTDAVWKRYYIKYALDYNDLHSLDEKMYDNHDVELSTEPLGATNLDLVTIKGLNQVDIPFSLGARKAKLNWLEELAKLTLRLVDGVTGVFGGGTNFADTIGDRKDCLKISQQYFSITKALYGPNGKQSANFLDVVSAKSLWIKYHYINAIEVNGWLVKQNARMRISSQDFVTLLENNFAQIDGEVSEILSVKYIDEKAFAEVTYRTKNNYAFGKAKVIYINQ